MAQMLKKVIPDGSTIDVLPQSGGIGNPFWCLRESGCRLSMWPREVAFDGSTSTRVNRQRISVPGRRLNKVFAAVIFRKNLSRRAGWTPSKRS